MVFNVNNDSANEVDNETNENNYDDETSEDETSKDDNVVVNDDEYNNEDGIGHNEDLQDKDIRTDDKGIHVVRLLSQKYFKTDLSSTLISCIRVRRFSGQRGEESNLLCSLISE